MRYVSNGVVRLYERSPTWARSIASSLYGAVKHYRESPAGVQRYLDELRESQWWSRERLEALQQRRLRDVVEHAASRVPYYRNLFAEHGIAPSQMQSPDDLKRLPTLSKEAVRRNARSLIADGLDIRKIRSESTSGTTGTPLTAYMDDRAFLATKAVQYLHRSWGGYSGDDWIGVLGGYQVVPLDRRAPPFWIRNYIDRQVHLSTYHLRPDRAALYLDELAALKVKYLRGYPSAIGLLARFAGFMDRTLPLAGVFLNSEPILPWQRKAIGEVFGCPIYNYYGQIERVVIGAGCGVGEHLHVSMETGIVEFAASASLPGQSVVVGTSLMNYAMPLIRYEINDIASPVQQTCACGRGLALMTPVETRAGDFLITPEGNYLAPTGVAMAFNAARGVATSQIVQDDPMHLTIRVVPTSVYTSEDATGLILALRKMVGDAIDIDVETVGEISRTANGKFQFVVSEVARRELGMSPIGRD